MKKTKKVQFNLEQKSGRDSEIKFAKENMIVAVRIRPLNNRELEYSSIETVKIAEKNTVTVLDSIEFRGTEEISKGRNREQKYAFDFVFDKNVLQDEVYMNTTNFLLNGVVEGYSATVFAYGATGAGKTFTMVGSGDNPGVMVRSMSDLFTLVDQQVDKNFRIKISYLEIYNESIRDLLDDNAAEIDMREDPSKGIMLVGLSEIFVTNASEVYKLLL
jgi:kinesin family protein 18/19